MPDLSKIKLNGVEYNIKDTVARNAVSPPLVTQTNDGLMSALDKKILDNLNPNVITTLSNLNSAEFHILNAKQANALGLTIAVEPVISEQIRTSNLLDISVTFGNYYIGSNGAINASASDMLGDFIPVTPGQDIYYTGHVGETTTSSVNRRLHVYKADKTWIKQISFAGSLRVGQDWSTHGVVPSNGAYVRVSWGITDTNLMITAGEPTKYEPYYITPFAPITSVNFKIGTTSNPEEATIYTFNVPAAAGDQYGFTFDPIAGKLYSLTGHIASYNGETLPDHWWSDRDIYIEGTTPQMDAEVIYRLAEEDIVEYDFSPMTIPLSYHINYFFMTNGFFQELKYYAETLAVDHLTINTGATFGETNIIESNVTAWNHAADVIDAKANLDSPAFTGKATAVTLGITNNSDRLATTAFVQQHMHNLAPFEATSRASRDYSAGEYLTYAGYLYKVTTAIAKNTSLAVGTNIEATDVVTELNLLRSLIESQGG